MHYDTRQDRLSRHREASWMRSFGSGMSTVSDYDKTPDTPSKPKKRLLMMLLFAVTLSATVLTGVFGDQDPAKISGAEPSTSELQLTRFITDHNECLIDSAPTTEAVTADPLFNGDGELRPRGVTINNNNPVTL